MRIQSLIKLVNALKTRHIVQIPVLKKAELAYACKIVEILERVEQEEKAKRPVPIRYCKCDNPSGDGVLIGGFVISNEQMKRSRGAFQRCVNCGGRLYVCR